MVKVWSQAGVPTIPPAEDYYTTTCQQCGKQTQHKYVYKYSHYLRMWFVDEKFYQTDCEGGCHQCQ